MAYNDNAASYYDYCLLIVLGQQLFFIHSQLLARGPTSKASVNDHPSIKDWSSQVLQSPGGRWAFLFSPLRWCAFLQALHVFYHWKVHNYLTFGETLNWKILSRVIMQFVVSLSFVIAGFSSKTKISDGSLKRCQWTYERKAYSFS